MAPIISRKGHTVRHSVQQPHSLQRLKMAGAANTTLAGESLDSKGLVQRLKTGEAADTVPGGPAWTLGLPCQNSASGL